MGRIHAWGDPNGTAGPPRPSVSRGCASSGQARGPVPAVNDSMIGIPSPRVAAKPRIEGSVLNPSKGAFPRICGYRVFAGIGENSGAGKSRSRRREEGRKWKRRFGLRGGGIFTPRPPSLPLRSGPGEFLKNCINSDKFTWFFDKLDYSSRIQQRQNPFILLILLQISVSDGIRPSQPVIKPKADSLQGLRTLGSSCRGKRSATG